MRPLRIFIVDVDRDFTRSLAVMLGLESLFELRRVKPCAEMVKMTACRMETLVAQAVYAGVNLLADDDQEFFEGVQRFLAARLSSATIPSL